MMTKLQKLTLIGLTVACLSATTASAALTYRVDTSSQQIIFNGSWLGGVPHDASYVDWEIRTLSGPSYSSSTVNSISGSAFDTEGTTFASGLLFGASVGQNTGDGVDLIFDILFTEHSGLPGVLTIDNLTFSYSSFNAEVRSFINQLPTLQTTMTLDNGTGYGDIVYAIPEPAYLSLLLGGFVAALLIGRRVKRASRLAA